MGKLHPSADKLLLEICKYYNATGATEFNLFEAGISSSLDPFTSDLESECYVYIKQDINSTIVLLDKTIAFARQLQ